MNQAGFLEFMRCTYNYYNTKPKVHHKLLVIVQMISKDHVKESKLS